MSQYVSDSEPDDNDSSSADDDMRFDLDSEGVQEQVEGSFHMRLMHQDHMELLLNTYPRYGTSQLKMPDEQLRPQHKHLFEHRILHYHATMAPMIAC